MTAPATVPVVFAIDELWLLQRCTRHELGGQETWKYPPSSLDLNDQIAEAIDRCYECGLTEAPLILSRGDCLLIDFAVPQDAKDAHGKPIGRLVLLKSFRARAIIRGDASDEPGPPDAEYPKAAEFLHILKEE